MHIGFMGIINTEKEFVRFIKEAYARSCKLKSTHLYFVPAQSFQHTNRSFDVVRLAAKRVDLNFKLMGAITTAESIAPKERDILERANQTPGVIIIPIKSGYGVMSVLENYRNYFRLLSYQKAD